jgi:hypothetical protein
MLDSNVGMRGMYRCNVTTVTNGTTLYVSVAATTWYATTTLSFTAVVSEIV